MRKLLIFAVTLAVLGYAALPQFRSFGQMGENRFDALRRPSKELVVGITWPFSVNHDGMAEGLQLALDEINAHKLAGEYTVRLVIRDDAFSSEKAKKIAVEFANTPEMSAVIGYYVDSFAVKSSSIFESSRLLHLITGANNTAMTAHKFKYIVRTILSSEKIGRSLAQMTVDRGYRKVAVIWEEDAYGEDLAYQYQASLDHLNTRVSYKWSYSLERPDFREPVNELKGLDFDALFFSGIEPWAGDFLRAARGVGLNKPIIGAFSDTPEMRKRAGSALEGAMFFNVYNVDAQSQENLSFVRKFSSRYGKKPDVWAAQGYDTLHILAKAVKTTGSRNPLDLSYAIRYMDAWEGANGRYKFNAAGNLEDKPIFLEKIEHGQSVVIQEGGPLPNAAP